MLLVFTGLQLLTIAQVLIESHNNFMRRIRKAQAEGRL